MSFKIHLSVPPQVLHCAFMLIPTSSAPWLPCPISPCPASLGLSALATRAVQQMEISCLLHPAPGTTSEGRGWSQQLSPSVCTHGMKQLFSSCTSQSPHGITLVKPTSSGAESRRGSPMWRLSQPCTLPLDSALPVLRGSLLMPQTCYATMQSWQRYQGW